jgi:hypothetical protein
MRNHGYVACNDPMSRISVYLDIYDVTVVEGQPDPWTHPHRVVSTEDDPTWAAAGSCYDNSGSIFSGPKGCEGIGEWDLPGTTPTQDHHCYALATHWKGERIDTHTGMQLSYEGGDPGPEGAAGSTGEICVTDTGDAPGPNSSAGALLNSLTWLAQNPTMFH